MKNKFLLIPLLFLLASCTDDNFEEEKQPVSFTAEESRVIEELARKIPKLTEIEAMQYALDAASCISPSSVLTKANTKTIKNSLPLSISRNISTRSSTLPDTVAYIFNFDNNEGFAIVAADIRVPDKLLAYVETGSLELETDNPGLAIFLDRAEEYIKQSLEKAEAEKDSIFQVILDKLIIDSPELAESIKTRNGDFPPPKGGGLLGPDGKPIGGPDPDGEGGPIIDPRPGDDDIYCLAEISYHDWQNAQVIGPLTAVEWNQRAPYNTLLQQPRCDNNELPPVGCVAVAVAQIMAHWKYPQEIKPYFFNWNEMVRYTGDFERNNRFGNKWVNSVIRAPAPVRNNIAQLMERIGFNVGIEYDCDASSGNSDKAVSWMQRMGFLGGEKSDYDINKIRSSLLNNSIVYARGSSKKNKFLGITIYYSGGHAWNYDGLMEQKRQKDVRYIWINRRTDKVIRESSATFYEYRNLVHCNWGWDGISNGYYHSGVFDTNSTPPLPSGTRNSEGTSGHYQYDLEIYTNLRR